MQSNKSNKKSYNPAVPVALMLGLAATQIPLILTRHSKIEAPTQQYMQQRKAPTFDDYCNLEKTLNMVSKENACTYLEARPWLKEVGVNTPEYIGRGPKRLEFRVGESFKTPFFEPVENGSCVSEVHIGLNYKDATKVRELMRYAHPADTGPGYP